MSCQCGGARIITINGEYFNRFNDFNLTASSVPTRQTQIGYNFTGVLEYMAQQKHNVIGDFFWDVFDTSNNLKWKEEWNNIWYSWQAKPQ